MISDKLYELAFKYKKTRLWNKLTDTHIFAVRLSDGNIGYICIMGMIGEHCAIALYIGDNAFNSFRSLYKNGNFMSDSFEAMECFFRQNCLQCEFTGKNDLSEEEYMEARCYTRNHGIRIAGKNAYPRFVKYAQDCYPWYLQNEQEQEQLCEALSAAIEVADLLEKNKFVANFEQFHDAAKYIPLLELKDGAYTVGKTEIPEDKPYEYPEPELGDLDAARLKKAKRIGRWECEIIRFPEPVQNEVDEVPVYPMTLIAVNTHSNWIVPIIPITNYAEDADKLLNNFVECLLESNTRPQSIVVNDPRTYSFFKSLCARLNITLRIDNDLETLDEAKADFLKHFYGHSDNMNDEFDEIMDALSSMDESELHFMLCEQLKELAKSGILPREEADKLNKILFSEQHPDWNE